MHSLAETGFGGNVHLAADTSQCITAIELSKAHRLSILSCGHQSVSILPSLMASRLYIILADSSAEFDVTAVHLGHEISS